MKLNHINLPLRLMLIKSKPIIFTNNYVTFKSPSYKLITICTTSSLIPYKDIYYKFMLRKLNK